MKLRRTLSQTAIAKVNGSAAATRRQGWQPTRQQSLCSAWVLASLGLLSGLVSLPAVAQGAGGTLPAGTLPVLRGVVSGNLVVQAPRPLFTGAAGQQLTIEQSSQRAVVSWEHFNIAKGSEVTFYHPGVNASTLNRIYGNDPSIVQGALKSRLWDPATRSFSDDKVGGQLILINQNGILFDRGAQVNTGSLIASTLNLSNSRYLSGVLPALSAADSAPTFDGGYDNAGNPLPRRPDGSRPGTIGIGSFGASALAAPLIEVAAGGSVFIFAPRVDNDSGVIRAPDGQVILAAGRKVFLSQNANTSDITLRGLVVEVQAEEDGPGLNLSNLVRNAGDIGADRGNVSLAALAVNQEGRISAKTAVQANGSVFLSGRARTATGTLAGQVTLAKGSLTEVQPDTADRSTVADSADYKPFRGLIDVQAGRIASSGTLSAAGGRVLLSAADAADPSAARVYLDTGSLTSVAGAWTDVDFAKNLVSFRVTSNELKNAPDQKAGLLRGATVTVDLRRNNNILALDGYRDTVARTVSEKAAVGGDISIRSTGDVVQRSGATLDASGGGYRYSAGMASTTRLLGADGKVYDIATAPQALGYVAQLDRVERVDARFNQTITYNNPLGSVATPHAAYAEGKAGGTLLISSAAGLVLDGALKGGVTVGSEQLSRAPAAAALKIGTGFDSAGNYNVGQRIGNLTLQNAAVDSLAAGFGSSSALTAAQRSNFALAATQLYGAASFSADGRVEAGFGSVELNSDGRIQMPQGVRLTADMGASLLLNAQAIDIGGQVLLPAGSVTLRPLDPPNALPPSSSSSSERIVLRSGASISTAGAWLNNANRDGSFVGNAAPSARLAADGTLRTAVQGGSITLQINDPTFGSRLERGATLDVSGGGALSSNQRLTAGNGGKLAVANGNAAQSSSDWLQADLLGHAFGTGAELTLNFNRALLQADGANGTLPADTTRLEAGLFTNQGFAKINVNTFSDLRLEADTALVVQQKNLVLDYTAANALPTGGNLRSVARVQTLPAQQRGAASLSLSGGTLVVADTASIRTDARGQIALAGIDALRVDGQLTAPGGSISLSLRGPVALTATDLQIGSSARLSTAGVFVQTPNDSGSVLGTLYNGGSITLSAAQAGVNVATGAVIDVRGVNQVVDSPSTGTAPAAQQQTLTGHAGSVLIKSQGATSMRGTLRGQGGDANAAGGSFALESTRPDGQLQLPAERRIVVQQSAIAAASISGVIDAVVDSYSLQTAGFSKLRLLAENSITFQGSGLLDFSRGIRLDAPVIDLLGSANVEIRTANAALGQSLGRRVFDANGVGLARGWGLDNDKLNPAVAPRAGNVVLSVQAAALDVFGNLTVSGTQLTRLTSSSDLRFIGRAVSGVVPGDDNQFRQQGALRTAGSLELKADQLYPTTRTSFTVESTGADAYILVRPGDGRSGAVYSVAGAISLRAATIVHNGSLRAPQGQIRLQASQLLDIGSGSLTSVSGDGLMVLYGSTESGLGWNYADGRLNQPAALAAVSDAGKRIELQAPTLTVQSGARVDLTGGGDVRAVEFVPGNGGDKDITLAENTYAIVPAAALARAPHDTDTLLRKDPGLGFAVNNGRDALLYDGLQIGTGSAVPAGNYALLPARYALLPGAFLVQLQTGTAYRNLQAGQNTALANGDVVVAGHRVGLDTTARESQSVGVVVLPGARALRSSDYTQSGAALFASEAERTRASAPLAPWDAGRLLLADATALTLQGDFLTSSAASPTATAARVAQVDIQGTRIAVVDAAHSAGLPAGTLQVAPEALTRLNASVLVGGRRSDTADGVQITTVASDVRVANSAATAVALPELLLAARDRIDIGAGSVLRTPASSGAAAAPTVIYSEATGALVRLSSSGAARVDRGTASASVAGAASTGDVRIGAGAVLSASRSLLVDATRSTQSNGNLRAGSDSAADGAAGNGAGGSLSLSSGIVSLGQPASGNPPTGLVLSNADLAAYAALDALLLRGYERIDLGGDAALGSAALQSLTLDTPLLRGSAAQALVTARELTLINSGSARAAASAGSGQLTLQAQTLTVGAGDKALTGFASITLQAGTVLRSAGTGTLRSGGALDIQTPLLQASSGSQQRFSALDDSGMGIGSTPVHAALTLRPVAAGNAAAADPPGLGGRLTLEGSSVAVATAVQARSGQITVQALGTGINDNVTLTSGARLDTAGQLKDFNGSRVAADGGSVSLLSSAGRIDVQRGATVDVSAAAPLAAGGPLLGDAGQLTLRGSTLQLAGELLGQAAAGSRSGRADVDLGAWASAGAVQDFSGLNRALNSGGFAQERLLRLRSGDVTVAAADGVAARSVSLTADAGRIDVVGTVGTVGSMIGSMIGSTAQTGSALITLNAATGLSLAAGSQILAQAAHTAGERGGEVRASTRSGLLAFEAGATIDVRAADGGAPGAVTFSVLRDAAGTLNATTLQGQVLRRSAAGDSVASVDLEATRVYGPADVGSTVSSSQINAWATQHQAFANAASATAGTLLGGLRDEQGALQGARLLGAVELQAAGNLSIDNTWDLSNSSWLTSALPGTLSVRAAGTLTLRDTLGAPRLPTSTNVSTNDANQNINHAVRAGDTWNIRLAAGADLASAHTLATRTQALPAAHAGDLLLSGANANIRTGTGRIELAAARHVQMDNVLSSIYTAGRIGAADTEQNGNNRWAVDGGNITIRAGGNVAGPQNTRDLWITEWLRRPRLAPAAFAAAGSPTDWWSYRPRFQQAVGTLAGGDIDIRAGGDVLEFSAMLPTAGRTSGTAAAGPRQVSVTGGGTLLLQASGNVVGGAYLIGRGQGLIDAGGDIGKGQSTQVFLQGFSSGAVPDQAMLILQAGGLVALKSADNPTTLDIGVSTGAAGPSFHPTIATNTNANTPATFFTYAANSGLAVQAKGGDVSYDSTVVASSTRIGTDWRLHTNAAAPAGLAPSAVEAAAPPKLSLVAFSGSVLGLSSDNLRSYPSATGTVSVLAQQAVFNLGLEVSQLSPAALVTPTRNFTDARNATGDNPNLNLSSSGANSSKPRINERSFALPFGTDQRADGLAPFYFDIQALTGSVSRPVTGSSTALVLPAASRVRAGLDIAGVQMTLQNLVDTDLTELRADTGDIRNLGAEGRIAIGGPGRLVLQAGRNIDLGASALVAYGNSANSQLPSNQSARVTLIAGVRGDVNLARMDSAGQTVGAYEELVAFNKASQDILDFYAQLASESGSTSILAATSVAALARDNPAYARYIALDTLPRALQTYQAALRQSDAALQLPLTAGAERDAAVALYCLLNSESDLSRLRAAGSVAALSQGSGGQPYQAFVALDTRYPRLFADYLQRRGEGALPTSIAPLIFSAALDAVVAQVVPKSALSGGSILSYRTSVQTQGGSGIDLWAPAGDVVVGLTSPPGNTTIGVHTTAGGAVRSVLSGDLNVNQGKVITAQGGDILLYSARGSIDAGRGAKTSATTAPPTITRQSDGTTTVSFSGAATGSGIQSLTSDPDGLGPQPTPAPGNVYLFAPAGSIDAGEAGIRSGGNILINAQVVRNASDIRAGGSAQGVPQLQVGNLASALASSNSANPGKAAEDSAKAAGDAARKAAAAPPPPKPTILSVEVLGFGDKNCKEDDKECFAK